MAGRQIKSVSRGRKLTPKEATRYKKLRDRADAEAPDVRRQWRQYLAERIALADTFERLKEIREKQGKSLADMEELTGMDRSAISKLENGRRENFSIETMLRYADAVGAKLELTIRETKPVA